MFVYNTIDLVKNNNYFSSTKCVLIKKIYSLNFMC